MGEQDIRQGMDGQERRAFTRALLDDLRALERILEDGRIESGIQRIGAEQEMFLIDRAMAPASISTELLEGLDDGRFTTELGRFNLEANLAPQVLGGSFLKDLHDELEDINAVARTAAEPLGADVLLIGILPTLQKAHLSLEHMTPMPRYYELNEKLTALRGGTFRADISGTDELKFEHDNVMLEACNTSYQLHWQVSAEDFASRYNIAQLITAPLLAAAVNSSVLLGKRLWHETRIALFEQSVDVRDDGAAARGQGRRVFFGHHWVESGVHELFQENVSDHRLVMTRALGESSTAMLDRGAMPKLDALCLHSGTVYRWNRPCFGVVDGVPHLRIENRVLPAGPTVLDEVANAALFFGLMAGMPKHVPDPRGRIPFDAVRANFTAAAQQGLYAGFHWLDERDVAADELLVKELIPIAREGLLDHGTAPADVDRYLGLMEERVKLRRTGALWMVQSLERLGTADKPSERIRKMTRDFARQQWSGKPIHEWVLAEPPERAEESDWRADFQRVDQLMSTKLHTVSPDDVVDLAASLMDWKHIRHVPVEEDGKLVGILSSRAVLRLVARGEGDKAMAIRDLMRTEVVTIGPHESPLVAIDLMKEHGLGSLPVVDGERRLLGIISERDFLAVATQVLREVLSKE
jgi:CBS domain-containing protein